MIVFHSILNHQYLGIPLVYHWIWWCIIIYTKHRKGLSDENPILTKFVKDSIISMGINGKNDLIYSTYADQILRENSCSMKLLISWHKIPFSLSDKCYSSVMLYSELKFKYRIIYLRLQLEERSNRLIDMYRFIQKVGSYVKK